MLEENTSLIINAFIGLLGLFFFLSVFYVGFNLNQVHTYKQDVNYQIERCGGLTVEAIENLDSIDKEDKFSVESSQLGEKLEFGTKCDYTVVGKVKILFWDLGDFNYKLAGSAESLVR
ncbi:MAG: hypothetical protein LBN08_03875 [Lactobacillales bacterium]|jgi:hypothetical protein|nr:hypothetical protein [Lactobacillales bacterium]